MPYELLPLLRGRGDGEAMTEQTLAEQSLKTGDRWAFRYTISDDSGNPNTLLASITVSRAAPPGDR